MQGQAGTVGAGGDARLGADAGFCIAVVEAVDPTTLQEAGEALFAVVAEPMLSNPQRRRWSFNRTAP